MRGMDRHKRNTHDLAAAYEMLFAVPVRCFEYQIHDIKGPGSG